METTTKSTKKGDFVEILYTGYTNGNVFDSNIPEDLKKIDDKAAPKKTIVVIGERMVVPGLDAALENKEIGKEYEILLKAKEGFGERDKNMLKTIPLKVFTEKNINPKPGMAFAIDNMLVKIVAVSGARVITDFNNPLAGKEITYKYKITRILEDEKEKASSLLEQMLQFIPEFEIKSDELIIKGEKRMEALVPMFKDKIKSLLNKDLKFELVEKKKDNLETKTENIKEKEETKEEEKEIKEDKPEDKEERVEENV